LLLLNLPPEALNLIEIDPKEKSGQGIPALQKEYQEKTAQILAEVRKTEMYNIVASLTSANKYFASKAESHHNLQELHLHEFTIFMLSCPSQLFNKLNINLREKII